MRFYEYETKQLFQKAGITIPRGKALASTDGLAEIYDELQDVVLKAQVLAGGRGKAGGIKFPTNKEEALVVTGEMLSSELKGHRIHRVLLEEKLDISEEYYLSLTLDRSSGMIVALASTKGGMDIETVAREDPASLARTAIDIRAGLPAYRARDFLRRLGVRGKELLQLADILLRLYDVLLHYEARVVEVNPLVKTNAGTFVAADAKMDVDDEALPDHPELRQEDEFLTPLEREARGYNLRYVEMDGDIGAIGNGAGLNITSLDILRFYGGEPANFLEVSGRTYMLAEKALALVLKNPRVKGVFGNFFGSISRCDVIAAGLVKYIEESGFDKPMVVAMRGLGGAEGRATLKKAGIRVYENDRQAGKEIVELIAKEAE